MKIIWIFILTFFFTVTYSQDPNNTKRFNDRNIYYNALTQYLAYIQKERNKSIDTIYIEDDFRLTDSILLYSKQTTFIKLKYENISKHLKSHKGLVLFRLFPLRYENGEFSVSFVPFSVTYERRKRITNYANPGSYRIVYKFEDNRFIFLRVEDYGI